MPTRTLPENPSLENLKKQAKSLSKDLRLGEAAALAEVKEFHPRGSQAATDFKLSDAQLVIARLYGFASWAKLKDHLEVVKQFAWNPPQGSPGSGSAAESLIRLSCLAYDGSWRPSHGEKAQELLQEHPELAGENIHVASSVGAVETVKQILARHPELAAEKGGPLRWEPLLYACYSRLSSAGAGGSTLEVARVLLAAGADPNAGFLWKGNLPPFTALTGAFGRGEAGENEPPHEHWRELARMLLVAGADPNDGQTLYNRHFEANDEHLTLLFEFGLGQEKGGPWFNRMGERLQSPSRLLVEELWSAARKNYFERVKLLLEHGVEVNTAGVRDGRTPYEAAMRAGNIEIAEYLLQHGAKRTELTPEDAFAAACINGWRDKTQAILQHHPRMVEKIGAHRRIELLHRAVEANRPEGIRLMVELGFEINGTTKHDNVGMYLAATPLHNAAWMGNREMAKLLVELGADLQARDPNYNGTPLDWATYNNKKEVAQYLASIGPREVV